MDLGAFVAASLFGLRHGFDWDHLAAITDIAGSQSTTRRSIVLSTLYALGHGVVVLLLGVLAITAAARVPEAVDTALTRLAGLTLVGLGVYILWSLARRGPALPTRSRWMLVIDAGRSLIARLQDRSPTGSIVIEHSHAHDHDGPGHVHEHDLDRPVTVHDGEHEADRTVGVVHGHVHHHLLPVPRDPFASYTAPTAFGIGMLHGIGAETPTQVLLFVAAREVGGTAASIGMLLCFVVGVLVTNVAIAVAAAAGFSLADRHRGVVASIALAAAVFSLGVGVVLLAGWGESLPTILG